MPKPATLIRFDLGNLGAAEVGAPAAERVLAGAPRTKTWILDETPDGKQFTGVWVCTPGRWRIAYDEWEFCSLIEGHSIVTEEGGVPQHLHAGDSLVLRPGFCGTWEVVETTRKLFVVRYP